jgi:bacillithiol system protein YtxJ
MRRLRSVDEAREALSQAVVIVFKHSTRCGVSAAAYAQVRSFLDSHPDVPVCLVDVIEDREISAEITRASSVPHESPQVLLLKGGRVVWHASHYGITAEAVARECLKAD